MLGNSQISLGSLPRKHHSRPASFIFHASLFIATSLQSPALAKGLELPILLDDKELDFVTAQGGSVTLDLSASAQGAGATSSTEGSVITAGSTILRVALDRQAPEAARARLLGVEPVNLIFAAGHAAATGDSNAQCSASLVTAVDLYFIMQSTVAAVTATSATCSCAAFAIAPVGP